MVTRSRRSAPARTHLTLPLRSACVAAARLVIARYGVEQLSLRAVARTLGVSHYAPYKHFPTRDHLLSEVLRECFRSFSLWLDGATPSPDPHAALGSLGERYLEFAEQNALEYRLMFATPWPTTATTPELIDDARRPFEQLRDILRRIHGNSTELAAKVDLDALYIWSAMHGLAGVLHSSAVRHIAVADGVHERAVAHIMERVGLGLQSAD
jgi:AcrR family transcriptional regulator